MLLKNFMEDKQLDFNQPLLSVRRFSSTGTSSDVEVKTKPHTSLPKVPKLPVYKSELKSGPIRNPGTVPFIWEQTPGRPKDGSKSVSKALQRPPTAPKLPPGRILKVNNQASEKGSNATKSTWIQTGSAPTSARGFNGNERKSESYKDEMEKTESSSSDDDDEAYVDAPDKLSRTESFFSNCSVSGVSGLDDVDLKPSGTFATDPHTRDFMMGRFLPAAKAMASETQSPQHTARKKHLPQEQPRPRIITVNNQKPIQMYSPNNVHFHSQDKGLEESDDEDGYDGHEYLSPSICGLLPRFCLKNSFGLANSVPGMIARVQEPVFSSRGAQNFRGSPYEQRSRSLTADIQQTKLVLAHESNKKLDGSPLHSHLQGNLKSINKNENSQSSVADVNGFDLSGKGSKNFLEILARENPQRGSSGITRPAEKTLYVDSVHKVKSPNSSRLPSDARMPGVDNTDSPVKHSREIESSVEDIKHLNLVDSGFLLSPARAALDTPYKSGLPAVDMKPHDNNLQLILPLPPPKSPTDSWLKRTLPSVPKKTSALAKSASASPKWETIVKTSHVTHGHSCFSEDILAPIPEN